MSSHLATSYHVLAQLIILRKVMRMTTLDLRTLAP